MNTTKETLRIVEIYGRDSKQSLMRDLKILQVHTKKQELLKVRKALKSIINI